MKRMCLYVADSLKMHSYLWLDTILLNPRKVHSAAPYMADSASMEGQAKWNKNRKPMCTEWENYGLQLVSSVLKAN